MISEFDLKDIDLSKFELSESNTFKSLLPLYFSFIYVLPTPGAPCRIMFFLISSLARRWL